MKKVLGLLRVSSNDQKNGHGFDRQKNVILNYAKKNRLDVVGVLREDITGTSDVITRESVQRLLEIAKKEGVDTLLVENAGRYARDKDVAIKGMYALESLGIKSIIFCDKGMDFMEEWNSDPLSAVIPFIEIAYAEKEKDDLVEKLSKARAAIKAEKGHCGGRIPYGFKLNKDGNLVENEEENLLIKRAKNLRRKPRKGKRLSYAKVAEKLSDEGFMTRKQTHLTAMQVQRLVAS